jgi:hypothetical protein
VGLVLFEQPIRARHKMKVRMAWCLAETQLCVEDAMKESMPDSDSVLDELWTQAAFASGWPTICCECPSEEELLQRLNQLT